MERDKGFRFPIGTIVQHFKREMITTFGHKRRIRLYYNEESGIWSMCG